MITGELKVAIEKSLEETEQLYNALMQKYFGAVSLFLRPRRFGKTLNMSMLKYFFDIRNSKENSKYLLFKRRS